MTYLQESQGYVKDYVHTLKNKKKETSITASIQISFLCYLSPHSILTRCHKSQGNASLFPATLQSSSLKFQGSALKLLAGEDEGSLELWNLAEQLARCSACHRTPLQLSATCQRCFSSAVQNTVPSSPSGKCHKYSSWQDFSQ